MGLFNFVEQYDAVRMAAHPLGEFSAFSVPDVSRRRADQTADIEFFHVFGHIHLNERIGVSEDEFRQRLGQQRLAHAGRTQEDERADRPVRILQIGARTAQRPRDGADRIRLSDHGVGELLLHAEQTGGLSFLHLRNRHPGQLRDDDRDFRRVDHRTAAAAEFTPFILSVFQFGAEGAFAVAALGGRLVVLFGDGVLLVAADCADLLFQGGKIRRLGRVDDPGACAGFVDHVDRLVGEEASGDVAVGQFRGRGERSVGIDHIMVRLIRSFESMQNPDGILHGRRFHHDRLKAAFERGVLLDALAVLVECGGADALKFSPGEGRLDDVGRIHRPFRSARADDGVQLVDEQNHGFRVADLVDDRLDPLFELPAVFGPGDHQRKIEREHMFVLQNFRNLSGGDRLGEPFDDRRLADARFSDQNRIVLGAAAENLNHPFDLVFPSDDRVEFSLPGDFRQIASEGVEGLEAGVSLLLLTGLCGGGVDIFLRRVFAGDEVRVECADHLFADPFHVHFQTPENLRRRAFPFPEQGEQQMFGPDIIIVHRLGFVGGHHDDVFQSACEGSRSILPGLPPGSELAFHFEAQRVQIQSHCAENGNRHAFSERDQSQQQMFGPHIVVIEPFRLFLGESQHMFRPRGEILEPGRQIIHISHNKKPPDCFLLSCQTGL